MSKLSEAASNIKRLSVMFKGMIELADEIDKVTSIETHIQELELAKLSILKENESLRAENDQIIESINVNNQRAQDIISEAYAKQEELAKQTEVMCDEKSEKNKTMIDALSASFEIERNAVESELKRSKDELADLKSQIEEQQVVLKDLKEAIASIKEKF